MCAITGITDKVGGGASCSSTVRTARARTSGEYLCVIGLFIAPSSQVLEPPTNPERFTLDVFIIDELTYRHFGSACRALIKTNKSSVERRYQ